MCAASQTRARTHPSDRLRTHALKHFALTHFANVRSCTTHSPQRSPLRQSRHRGAGMPRRTRARPRLARRTRRSELGPEGRSPSGWSPHSRRPAHCRPVLAVPQLWIRKSLPLPRTNSNCPLTRLGGSTDFGDSKIVLDPRRSPVLGTRSSEPMHTIRANLYWEFQFVLGYIAVPRSQTRPGNPLRVGRC